jgi:hypothetical protein
MSGVGDSAGRERIGDQEMPELIRDYRLRDWKDRQKGEPDQDGKQSR